ncbi:DUF5597 domain-containing protein [Microbacterium terrisoli]|uniref:DUF5597 domain-containing protein n=1 Tax=Microbacterium terrisoli TaxID=3242192 RepID=UPI002805F8C1|nr:DUF5597 domain-containing protein [Microbacterium protaetiae]
MGEIGQAWDRGNLTVGVDRSRFLVIGGEVHNSSSSTARSIDSSFDTIMRLGANTVLAPVSWELFEPEESRFNFELIDAMIAGARRRGLRLIPLWFGTWKNAASTYAPSWVKLDLGRFPRSELTGGRRAAQVSPFCVEAREADAGAFAALMRRIREVDNDNTVIAVQVENEMGLLGDSRDRSPLAETAFGSPVPAEVIAAVRLDSTAPLHTQWISHGSVTQGDWATVFPAGERADEAFMATAFASYTQRVADAGRRQHDVPMFVNAWLDAESVLDGTVPVSGGKLPGDYPSGGPVISVASIWEQLAPALDLLAVDAYVDDANSVFAQFAGRRGRLLVPELRADAMGVAQMFLAVGRYRAAGVSPFGIDALDESDDDALLIADSFRLLRAVAVLTTHDPDALMDGFILDAHNPHHQVNAGGATIDLRVADSDAKFTPSHGYGIAISEGGRGLYLIGRGFSASVVASAGDEAALLSASELDLIDGELVVTQHLNGDQTSSGTTIVHPHVGAPPRRGPIPTRPPATGITRIELFTY